MSGLPVKLSRHVRMCGVMELFLPYHFFHLWRQSHYEMVDQVRLFFMLFILLNGQFIYIYKGEYLRQCMHHFHLKFQNFCIIWFFLNWFRSSFIIMNAFKTLLPNPWGISRFAYWMTKKGRGLILPFSLREIDPNLTVDDVTMTKERERVCGKIMNISHFDVIWRQIPISVCQN